MSDFVSSHEKEEESVEVEVETEAEAVVVADPVSSSSAVPLMIDATRPQRVTYCGVCSLPPEYCQFGTCYERCLPWATKHCPQLLQDQVAAGEKAVVAAMEKLAVSDAASAEGGAAAAGGEEPEEEKKKKPKGGGAAAPKKAAVLDTRVVVTRIQRQKRKYVTVVAGMETIPDLKIKDAAKLFGKKFASGATVNEDAKGQKEVVIQGDVTMEIPNVLISEFKVSPSSIYILEDGSIRAYA